VTLERARKLAANNGFRLGQVLVDVVATAISDRGARDTFGAWWELPEAAD